MPELFSWLSAIQLIKFLANPGDVLVCSFGARLFGQLMGVSK
jgi:hypothetical protein